MKVKEQMCPICERQLGMEKKTQPSFYPHITPKVIIPKETTKCPKCKLKWKVTSKEELEKRAAKTQKGERR